MSSQNKPLCFNALHGRAAMKNSRKIGLARALSKLGCCSRSQAAELVRAGRVSLNGRVTRDPETPTRMAQDRLAVDGHSVRQEKRIYLMMNKPRGVITTASDEKGRNTVYGILEKLGLPWVSPVGRLDKASEGLLLLTNDSEWAAKILAPETHLEKTYHVRVDAPLADDLVEQLLAGVKTELGLLRAKRARVVRGGNRRTWIEIVLDEGKNRQIRRMFEHFGIEVLRLVRIAIGPLALGQLAKGQTRALTQHEKKFLDRALGFYRVNG